MTVLCEWGEFEWMCKPREDGTFTHTVNNHTDMICSDYFEVDNVVYMVQSTTATIHSMYYLCSVQQQQTVGKVF